MTRDKYLIIVAGGSGTRMGGGLPKQFMEIKGKSVLHHSLLKFVSAFPDIKVLTVLPDNWRKYWTDYCYSHNVGVTQKLVSGGITRFHSVKNALGHVPDGALAAVHDSVRPLFSADLARRLFAEAERSPAVVPVIPVTDTLKVLENKVEGNGCSHLVPIRGRAADRSVLYAAQTPQIFWSEVLKEAYTQPYSTSFTDDASVVESMGTQAVYPEGEKYNIKITVPDDLVIARALL